MDKKHRNIIAAAALSSIAEIKAFGLQKSFANIAMQEDVQQANELIKLKTGIDLLNNSTKLTAKQLEEYESALDDFVYLNLRNNIDQGTIAEEVKLLEHTIDYSISDFESLPFKSNFASKAVKRMFKELGINVPSISPIAKSPIRVQLIKGLFDEFLTISKFELRSKTIYVLFHLGSAPHASTAKFGFAHLDEKVLKGDFEEGGQLHSATCFFFSSETAHHTEPVFLFLKALNKYAKDTTIDSITRKYFFQGYTSELLLNKGEIQVGSKIIGAQGVITAGYIAAKRTFTGFEYGNAYTLDVDKMLSDYGSRKFQ